MLSFGLEYTVYLTKGQNLAIVYRKHIKGYIGISSAMPYKPVEVVEYYGDNSNHNNN